ncbi:hypothetical protein P154DRAFT_531811 [Amniculicola lignicola CBS 123094]|uniref:Mid2 domain-containing protein n=1 Tax=Amniculicola lignicola CBS 123094 TaxID=1392246 RepID=A0A6A5WYH2_9PLEO|nr:hypothetical protein P154DRAFT_531811 [Amniculicola lignicola CBS 123094]
MARLTFYSTLFLFAARGLAVWDTFYFATEASEYKCKDLPYNCVAPNACARDSVLDKHYCCGVGEGAVCFQGSSTCRNNTNNELESVLQPCSGGINAFCCLSDTERCTQTYNQINICWDANATPYGSLTEEKMNDTYSSSAAASPSATRFAFNLSSLTASTSASSATSTVASSTVSSATTQTTSTSTNTAQSQETGNDNKSNSGLSGGAIGGIVVGVVAILALVALGAFFYWKRSKKNGSEKSELDSNPYTHGPNGQYNAVATTEFPREKYAHQPGGPVEAPTHQAPVELMEQHAPVELDSSGPSHSYGR